MAAKIQSYDIFKSPFVLVQDVNDALSFHVRPIPFDQNSLIPPPNAVLVPPNADNAVVQPAIEQVSYERNSPAKRLDYRRRKSVVIRPVEDERQLIDDVQHPSPRSDNMTSSDVNDVTNDDADIMQGNDVTADDVIAADTDVSRDWSVAQNNNTGSFFGPEFSAIIDAGQLQKYFPSNKSRVTGKDFKEISTVLSQVM